MQSAVKGRVGPLGSGRRLRMVLRGGKPSVAEKKIKFCSLRRNDDPCTIEREFTCYLWG